MTAQNTEGNTKYPNLRPPWPKGVSGNPGGRPKRKPITDAITEALDRLVVDHVKGEDYGKLPDRLKTQKSTVAELIADRLISASLGKSGSVHAAKEIMDRVEGKVPIPVMGVDGSPLELTIVSNMARPERAKKPRSKGKK